VLVSDPIDGHRRAEVRLNGATVLGWTEAAFQIVEPAGIAGQQLMEMRAWIESLNPAQQEAARMLRWANIMAGGRQITLSQWSDATRMPSNCYTFQPERKTTARFVGTVHKFNVGDGTTTE
jgi:hypothetical protein